MADERINNGGFDPSKYYTQMNTANGSNDPNDPNNPSNPNSRHHQSAQTTNLGMERLTKELEGEFLSRRDNDGKVTFDAKRELGTYAVKPLEDEENTFYENKQRADKIANVANIVIADYAITREAERFDRLGLDQKDIPTNTDLQSMGIGVTKDREKRDLLFTDSDVRITDTSGNQREVHISELSQFTEDEVRAMFESGYATRRNEFGETEKYEIFQYYEPQENTKTEYLSISEARRSGVIGDDYFSNPEVRNNEPSQMQDTLGRDVPIYEPINKNSNPGKEHHSVLEKDAGHIGPRHSAEHIPPSHGERLDIQASHGGHGERSVSHGEKLIEESFNKKESSLSTRDQIFHTIEKYGPDTNIGLDSAKQRYESLLNQHSDKIRFEKNGSSTVLIVNNTERINFASDKQLSTVGYLSLTDFIERHTSMQIPGNAVDTTLSNLQNTLISEVGPQFANQNIQIVKHPDTGEDIVKITKIVNTGDKKAVKVTHEDVNRMLVNAHHEKEREERIYNADSNKAKAAAMAELREKNLKLLKEAGIAIGKGTIEDLDKALADITNRLTHSNQNISALTLSCASLKAEIEKVKVMQGLTDVERNAKLKELMDSLSQKEELLSKAKEAVNTLTKQMSMINDHKNNYGDRTTSRHGQRKKAGLNFVANKVAGSDMMTGYNTTKYAVDIAAVGVRTAVRTADNVANRIAEKLIAGGFVRDNGMWAGIRDSTGFRINDRKAKRAAKSSARSGNRNAMTDYRINRRAELADLKQKKLERKQMARETRANRLESSGNRHGQKKANKLRQKNMRETKYVGLKGGAGDRFHKFKERIRESFEKLKTSYANSIFGKASQAVSQALSSIKSALMKYIIAPVGSFFLAIIILFFVIQIMAYAIFFISDNVKATNLTAQLNELNYIQLIVDDTSKNLTKNYMEVAQRDAQRRYLLMENFSEEDKEKMKMSGTNKYGSYAYEWYKSANLGQIRRIEDSSKSDGSSVSGLNSNLLPIVSAMHFRYMDEINFKSWYTAKAYCYYLWVETHNVKAIKTYSADSEPECENIYKATVNELNGLTSTPTVTYSAETQQVYRPSASEEICNNIYIHGYSIKSSIEANKAKASSTKIMNNVLSSLGLPELDASVSGVFINEIPCSPDNPNDKCKNYLVSKIGNETTKEAGHLNDKECGVYQDSHKHTANCYTVTCGLSDTDPVCEYKNSTHKHSNGDCSCDKPVHIHNTDSSCYLGTFYQTNCKSQKAGSASDVTHDEECKGCATYPYSLYKNCGNEHNHSFLCCNKHEHNANCYHTHTAKPADNYVCTKSNKDATRNDAYSACYTCTCGLDQHTHIDWKSFAEPGCWNTVFICKGHCGGHVTPLVDLTVDMTFEKVVSYDEFKTPLFLGAGDFSLGETSEENMVDMEDAGALAKVYEKASEFNDLKVWKATWELKMADWFVPWKASIESIADTIERNIVYAGAQLIDWFTRNLEAIIKGQDPAKMKEEYIDSMKSKADDALDLYDFDGWFLMDENENYILDANGKKQLNQGHIDMLKDLYGNWQKDGSYDTGIEAWEDFDVLFPANNVRPLSSAQIDSIISSLQITNEKREAVLRQGLDYVGDFWYDLKHPQGAGATSGRIDCSGFVSSVLRHSIGWQNDWTSSGFASADNDSYGSVTKLNPGDILAKNKDSSYDGTSWVGGGSNHVIIYLGYLPNGIEDYPDCDGVGGYYIIDCSSSLGGSAVRKVNDASFFNGYPWRYSSCYN